MSRPWMPLYIADYLADTAHLSAAEHGAYLLLIMHYWSTGGLPQEDGRLARIARMSELEWTAARPVIREFFGVGWRHERIDGELAEADRLSKAGKKGGVASAARRGDKRNPRPSRAHSDDDSTESERSRELTANDPSTIGQRSGNDLGNDRATISQAPQPPPQPQKDDDTDARAREPLISAAAMALAATFHREIGLHDPQAIPPEWFGIPHRAAIWLASGWTEPIIVATTRKIMQSRASPPGLRYFETAFANEFASLRAAVPTGKPSEKTHASPGNVIAAADRLVERVRQFDQPAPGGSGVVRIGAGAVARRTVPQG